MIKKDCLTTAFLGFLGGTAIFGICSIFSSSSGTLTAIGKALGDARILVQGAAHAISQGTLSLMQGGNFWSGAAAGFLGHMGGKLWGATMKGVGLDKFAQSTMGMVTFGAISGGIGAELSGGNFWQGAVTGGIVAGLNHAMHKIKWGDGNNPSEGLKKEVRKVTKNAISEIKVTLNKYALEYSKKALRFTFDSAEIVGGYLEIGGVVLAPFSEGTSLLLSDIGFKISTFGTVGNTIMDYSEGNYYSASYRIFKWGVSFGTGKVIGKYFSGFDKTVVEMHKEFYEKFVVPKIENNK